MEIKKGKLKYYIYTLGCQMNYSDSERFSTIVESAGYEATTKLNEADLIIFNTCSVRQKAEDRVIGMNDRIRELKKQNAKLKIVLTGCMARRDWKGKNLEKSQGSTTNNKRENKLKKVMPWVDIVIETKDFMSLAQRLGLKTQIKTKSKLTKDELGEYLSFTPNYSNKFQAFIPISSGCDHFCTYCIVPFARGNEVCRSSESIISEVLSLVQKGYKDITLLGQTVNRWINPKFDDEFKKGRIGNKAIPELNKNLLSEEELAKWSNLFSTIITEEASPGELLGQAISSNAVQQPHDFLQLLQVLDEIPGDWWMTWVSSHPNYMTGELIKFIGVSSQRREKACLPAGRQGLLPIQEKENEDFFGHQRPYMHFALQSGSDSVLKRMNRRYTYQDFKKIVDLMRESIPGIAISTDIIVGFPKETEEDFQKTINAMNECEFDMAFISEFSPRIGTAAGYMKDDVSLDEKARRKKVLNDDHLKVVALDNNKKMLNTEQKVLVERIDKKGNLMGRTSNNKEIRITNCGEQALIGNFVNTNVTSCTAWALEGAKS